MNNDENKKELILPILSDTIFMERFYGMEIFCPVDEAGETLQRIKILDHKNFVANNTRLEYDDNYGATFKGLSKYTAEKFVYNHKYYVAGKMYVNCDTYEVAKLKRFTPTELTFDNGETYGMNNFYRRDREWSHFTNSGHWVDHYNMWLRLDDNRVDNFIVDKRVISKDKLLERCTDNNVWGMRYTVIYDLEDQCISEPRDVNDYGTKIKIEYHDRWIDTTDPEDLKKYKFYRFNKTKTKLTLKEIEISDLYTDIDKSLDLNAIGKNNMMVFRIKDDDKYYISTDCTTAESIHGWDYESYKERTYPIIATPDQLTELYVINSGEIFDEVRPLAAYLSEEY